MRCTSVLAGNANSMYCEWQLWQLCSEASEADCACIAQRMTYATAASGSLLFAAFAKIFEELALPLKAAVTCGSCHELTNVSDC